MCSSPRFPSRHFAPVPISATTEHTTEQQNPLRPGQRSDRNSGALPAKIGETPDVASAGRSWERTNGCSCRTQNTIARPQRQARKPPTDHQRPAGRVKGAALGTTSRRGSRSWGPSAVWSCKFWLARRARCAPAALWCGKSTWAASFIRVMTQGGGDFERRFPQNTAAIPAALRAADHAAARAEPSGRP